MNTLLSFNEDLTDIEIENFVNELDEIVQEQNYMSAFQMAIDKIHEYPTCDKLLYSATLYLDGALFLYSVPEPEQYRETFETFYKRLSVNEIPEIRDTAISMLISYARNRGEYSKAEELINMLPFSTIDREEQLRKLRKERHRFQQGDLELKNAVTNISHDLRTPLTAISGYLDLLDNAEKSEEAERYIKVIRNRTEVLRQLTEELFCYSVVTSPEYDNDVEFVSVNSVLEESILGFYAVLQERNITPNISMPENKVFRKVNRAALSRIFSNLLNNAIKYSDGDLNITLNDTGEITFSNTASDLSEVDVKKLFDRFYTVENARKSTGLGLSISRILIEQMKGTISAQYKNGKLSICIWLPDVSGD